MEQVVTGATSKSEKMRRLAAAGYSRQEIADFLGVRYQFVYNVLAVDERKRSQTPSGMGESAASWENEPSPADALVTIKIGPDGTAVIPATVISEAGLRAGDSLIPDVSGEGDIRLLSGNAALVRAQELVRQSLRGKAGLVDEMLQERRRDAGNLARDAEKRHG